jgi:hypothetical protein
MSSLRGRALQNTYELAIGGRNQDAIQLALLHISGHLLKCDVRAKGTWPRLHHLFNELLGTTVQSMPLEQAKHNALLVHHHAARTCLATSPRRSVKQQVDTSRRMRSPTRGTPARFPSVGRPLACQSTFPAT